MIYGNFVDIRQIAEESGCTLEVAQAVADKLLQALHKTALINGLTGSLREASLNLSPAAAYHLGGIYGAIGEGDEADSVSETLRRIPQGAWWTPYREQMEAWEETLTDHQRAILKMTRSRS